MFSPPTGLFQSREAITSDNLTAVLDVPTRTVVLPFDKYEVVLELTADHQILGISEIRIKRDFLSHDQIAPRAARPDVERFYEE